ncbi:hypothetical protein EON73_01835 [bacterium]|nr:MAG: hypothetical protein EON73_01835 [bacterium]
MERTIQRIPLVRKTTGITTSVSFPSVKIEITIPANTTASLLLDQSYLTNTYLTLKFSKGKGAGISLTYAETLY